MLLETPHDMALGTANRFRDLRKQRKITIKSLSESSGVPYSTIRRFESSGEIGFLALVKLASAMGEDREIQHLFSETIPESIEEVIRGNNS